METNVFFFLQPKTSVKYLAKDITIQKALELMRSYKYTAMPVISEDGKYYGSISEGDVLWYLVDHNKEESLQTPITKIIRKDFMEAKRMQVPLDALFQQSLNQNYVPIVDDRNVFIGIVTRRSILEYLVEHIEFSQTS